MKSAFLSQAQIPQSNTRQVAHISPTLCKKLTSRLTLLRCIAGSGWGTGATTLQSATLALVHSTAEYCAPVWCRSAHTRLIDPAINDALPIATGRLRPTPTDNHPILVGIQPAELRCNGATLFLARHAMECRHLYHSALACPLSANAQRLKLICACHTTRITFF